jgi:S-adenosyl methyltransferase
MPCQNVAYDVLEAKMSEAEEAPEGVDPTTPSTARLYDYYLGGSANFAADRAMAQRMYEFVPEVSEGAWANRGFHQRAALWMAERGIRQFLDIGAGLPTQGNTHEVVLKYAPDAKVVYVDKDPMVSAHAAALLTGGASTAFVQADLRDPDAVLGNPDLIKLIDFAEPVGLLITAVMHFVSDADDPWGLVSRYVAALVPGSYLALSHLTLDSKPRRAVEGGSELYNRMPESVALRSKSDITRFFDGLEIQPPYPGAEPELTFVGTWGAVDADLADSDGSRWLYCAVARRP